MLQCQSVMVSGMIYQAIMQFMFYVYKTVLKNVTLMGAHVEMQEHVMTEFVMAGDKQFNVTFKIVMHVISQRNSSLTLNKNKNLYDSKNFEV